jgi:hypothetical protein
VIGVDASNEDLVDLPWLLLSGVGGLVTFARRRSA